MAYIIGNNCTACGDCMATCMAKAISAGTPIYKIDPDKCVDCGTCMVECMMDAIEEDPENSILDYDEPSTHFIVNSTPYGCCSRCGERLEYNNPLGEKLCERCATKTLALHQFGLFGLILGSVLLLALILKALGVGH